MASQNLPGVAAIRAAGYRMPISKIITLTGVATLLLAPFGAFALYLVGDHRGDLHVARGAPRTRTSATPAAVSCGLHLLRDRPLRRGGHRRADRHFRASSCRGRLASRCSAASAAAWPRALKDDTHREPGADHLPGDLERPVSLWGIGSAFWGVVAGALALFVQQWRPARTSSE
jgi:benzoate membrane transport protein